MRTKCYVMTVDKRSDKILEQLGRLQDVRDSVSLLNRHSRKN